eukprot:c677_g1_i1 orf=73-246(+)
MCVIYLHVQLACTHLQIKPHKHEFAYNNVTHSHKHEFAYNNVTHSHKHEFAYNNVTH